VGGDPLKIGVTIFPGSNCDRDALNAIERMGVEPVELWHADADLKGSDAVILPGGFSYGDYLRPGAIARFANVMAPLEDFARSGGPVLGVCNGFQVLTESGLLPGALMRNASLKFVCRDVHLKVENSQTLFTNRYEAGQVIRVPVAHGDGNYFADEETLNRLEGEGRIAFRYCSPVGETPDNPNGSIRAIAGIYNETKTVLGLMPHPENAIDAALGSADGRALFDGIAAALA